MLVSDRWSAVSSNRFHDFVKFSGWLLACLLACLPLLSRTQISSPIPVHCALCRAISLASGSLSTMCLTWRPKRRWAAVNYGGAPPVPSFSLAPRPSTPRRSHIGGVSRPLAASYWPLYPYANAAQHTSHDAQSRRSSQIGPHNERLSTKSVRAPGTPQSATTVNRGQHEVGGYIGEY